MGKYTLYLDESETYTSPKDRFFAVGGVIIDNSQDAILEAELNSLKLKLWDGDANSSSYILHEKEITEANKYGHAKNPCYNTFRTNKKHKDLYAGLAKILKQYKLTTLGVCIDVASLSHLYPGETNRQLTIALQMLLENYCHYLGQMNSTGDICYESLLDPGNQELRQRFYELEALGTMYYTSHFFQTHIGDIRFEGKAKNLVGLQLADFIPNTFARTCSGAKAKHDNFKKIVLRQAYDGNIQNKQKYGLKKIP